MSNPTYTTLIQHRLVNTRWVSDWLSPSPLARLVSPLHMTPPTTLGVYRFTSTPPVVCFHSALSPHASLLSPASRFCFFSCFCCLPLRLLPYRASPLRSLCPFHTCCFLLHICAVHERICFPCSIAHVLSLPIPLLSIPIASSTPLQVRSSPSRVARLTSTPQWCNGADSSFSQAL